MAADIEYRSTAFPGGKVGLPYEAAVYYYGDATSIVSSSVGSGELPPGLYLDTVAPFSCILGRPTTAGNFTFTIVLTDGSGDVESPPYTIRIGVLGIDDWNNLDADSNVTLMWPQG